MRRVVLLLATISLAVLLFSGLALAQTAPDEVPDASCPPNSNISDLSAHFRTSAIEAQTFTAEHSGLLTSAQVQVARGTNEPAGIVMEIRTLDSSGTPTNVVLASTTIPASDVPPMPPSGQAELVTGHFSPGAPVKAGQQYAIALYTSTETEVLLGPAWFGSTSNPCPGVLYQTHETHPGIFQVPSPDYDVFFLTFVTPDTTPPTVISTVPKANADEVAPTANVRATFSEDMQEASVMNAFKLFKKGSTNQIAAQVSYDAATDIATLNPTNNLRRGVIYKAVVTTVAKDVAGNRLDQDSSTAGLQQKVWFFEID
jgi:hypothetical protein